MIMPGRKPVRQCTESEWKRITQEARAVVPPPAGWTLRFYFSRTMDHPGDCAVSFEKKEIVVRVRRGYSPEYTRELVAHELAHALAWQHSPHVFSADHDSSWAQAYISLRIALVGAKYAKIYDGMFTDT